MMGIDPSGMYDLDERAEKERQRKTSARNKRGGVTIVTDKKTVTIYGPYAAAIAKSVASPKTSYDEIDCQQAIRFVIPGNHLKQ